MKKSIIAGLAIVLSISVISMPEASAITKEQYQHQVQVAKAINQYYSAGLQAYRAGNYQRALEYLGKVSNQYGNKMDWNLAVGLSFYKMSNYQNAIQYLGKAYKLGASGRQDVNEGLGMSFFALQNYGQAVQFLSKAGVNPDTLWYLALSYKNINNTNGEVQALKALISKNPRYNIDMYYLLGDIYLENNLLNDAISLYQVGIKVFPQEGGFYYGIGHAFYLDGNYEPAISWLLQAEQILKGNLDVLCELGFSYYFLDMLDDASNVCNAMAEIAPKDQRTVELTNAVQQKIMQKQMEQQMMIEQQLQIDRDMQEQINQAQMGI